MLLSEGNNIINYDSDNDEIIMRVKQEEPFEELLNEDCQEVLLPGNDDILKDCDDPMNIMPRGMNFGTNNSAEDDENEENLLNDLDGSPNEMAALFTLDLMLLGGSNKN